MVALKLRSAVAGSREKRSTRDLILDAAERRFAERGFAGVSVREIAADVGLKNQASLYHHFRNKRSLYEAVLARGVEALVSLVAMGSVAEVTASADGTTFAASLDRMIDYLIEHPQLPRLIQRAGIDDMRYLRTAVTRLLRPLYSEGLAVLATGGVPWEAGDLPHVAAGCYHLIFGYFTDAKLLEVVMQADPMSPEAVERHRRFLKTAMAQLLGGQRVAAAHLARSGKAPRPTTNT